MMANMRELKKLITFLLLLTGCGTPMISNALFGNSNKFDWLATESAPDNYPMQIIRGNLRYHGDSDGRGLYVPPCVRIVVASVENLINRQRAVKMTNDSLYRRKESFCS